MSKLFFTKEEKLAIENNVLKESNLSMQIQLLQNDRQMLIADFCKQNSQKTEDVLGVNVQEGSVEFRESVPSGKEENPEKLSKLKKVDLAEEGKN